MAGCLLSCSRKTSVATVSFCRQFWLPLLCIPLAFGFASAFLFALMMNAPSLPFNEVATSQLSWRFRFPSSIEELKDVYSVLRIRPPGRSSHKYSPTRYVYSRLYNEHYFVYTLMLFTSAYLFKQTFAIPGSVFLNILAGALYGVKMGLPLVVMLSATGATCCYLLSYLFARDLVQQLFPTRLAYFQQTVKANEHQLFFYLVCIRLFPVTPNWLLNIASPLVDVPILQFYLSVLAGLLPYNYVCVQGGNILSELNSLNDIFDFWTMLKLLCFALTAVLLTLLRKRWAVHRLERPKNDSVMQVMKRRR